MRRVRLWALISVAVLLVLIQFIPVSGQRNNPSVRAEPRWDSAQTRLLAERACFDCHSNETKWPWYGSVAPVSWFVIHDVKEGREVLNFSEWHGGQEDAEDAVETILEGTMPPRSYLLTHPEARLSKQEVQALVNGLQRSLAEGMARHDD